MFYISYTKKFEEINKVDVVIVGGKGASLGEMTQADKDAVGKHLAEEVVDNPSRVQEITANFKRQVDLTMDFMKVKRHDFEWLGSG